MTKKGKNVSVAKFGVAKESGELVPVSQRVIGDGTVMTVNARDLHAFLENKAHFADWIKERIEQFGFAQGIDFVQFQEMVKSSIKPRTEYALTIDMAKELSMVERTDQGKKARLYFIECERKAKAIAHNVPTTFHEALQLAADQAKHLAIAAPKIAAYETFLGCKNAMTFNEAAKVLGTGQRRLFQFCRDASYLIDGGVNHNMPYQEYMDRGYFEVREITIHHSDWTERKNQPLITTTGIDYLRDKMKEAA